MNINYDFLKTNIVLELDKEDVNSIPLSEKIEKLSEEVGELAESIQYFEEKEQIEEIFDTYNVCIVILHALKKEKLTKDFISSIIESTESKKPNFNNISIYIGKVNSALLLKQKSKITSKSTDESYLEKYVIEVLKEMVSFLKYMSKREEDYIIEEIIDSKIEKWKEKKEEF
jgi:NTP pyrophosphatase (non-canonical NTP hydrolase)